MDTSPEFIKCPICGGNRNEDRTEIKKICRDAVLTGELVNPGGRQLRFKATGDKWLQLADECSACDNKKIKQFLLIYPPSDKNPRHF